MDITTAVIQSNYKLPDKKEHQLKYLTLAGNELKKLEANKNLSIMCQCKILYYIRKQWDDIDLEVQGKWDYDYYKWASSFTQNDSINNPASSTIDNKIGVYKDYIAEPCITIPKEVKVRKTDSSGNPVGDGTQESDFEFVKPDLMWGNYTKLLHAKKPAKENLMTDELWSMVFDTTKSVKGLLKEIKGLPNADYHIVEKDGLLIGYKSNGESSVLAIINDEDNSECWKEGIAKLLKPYSHSMELDV